jgi:hypothetical protein
VCYDGTVLKVSEGQGQKLRELSDATPLSMSGPENGPTRDVVPDWGGW